MRGDNFRSNKTPMERIFSRRIIVGSCWEYRGNFRSNGYPTIWTTKKQEKVHRVIYEAIVKKIPMGMVLNHLCRNIKCFNPDHLEPVTNKENILRGFGSPARNSRKQFCSNGHLFTAKNTYLKRTSNHRQCRKCHNERNAIYKKKLKEKLNQNERSMT